MPIARFGHRSACICESTSPGNSNCKGLSVVLAASSKPGCFSAAASIEEMSASIKEIQPFSSTPIAASGEISRRERVLLAPIARR